MTRSLCTSCGLRGRYFQCCHQLASNANGDNGESAFKLTPASFCVLYLMCALVFTGLYFIILGMTKVLVFPIIHRNSYLVFAHSFFVSNANANATATADWNVGFTTRSLGNKCKFSLHTMKSRFLRGDKLISESATHDYFGLLVTGKINDIPLPYAVFKTVATPRDGVVWDIRVEVVSSIKIDDRSRHKDGFLILTCGNIPVNFTVEPARNVKGSLLGYMRPCEFPVTYF